MRGCSSASVRDAPLSNTYRPGCDRSQANQSRSQLGACTMTPPENSTHQDKIVVPTVEQSSNQSPESGQDCKPSRTPNPEAEAELEVKSESDREPPAPVRTYRLLPASGGFYHVIDDDGRPVCRTDGTFTKVPASEAREKTRICRNCKTLQEGQVDTHPCPKCGRLIRITRWPQHVRTCSGRSTDASDGEDP